MGSAQRLLLAAVAAAIFAIYIFNRQAHHSRQSPTATTKAASVDQAPSEEFNVEEYLRALTNYVNDRYPNKGRFAVSYNGTTAVLLITLVTNSYNFFFLA